MASNCRLLVRLLSRRSTRSLRHVQTTTSPATHNTHNVRVKLVAVSAAAASAVVGYVAYRAVSPTSPAAFPVSTAKVRYLDGDWATRGLVNSWTRQLADTNCGVLLKAVRTPSGAVRTPPGAVRMPPGYRPDAVWISRCDAVLCFAIYSCINFCIT